MFSSTQSQSFGYFACHLAEPAGEVLARLGELAAVVEPAQLLQAVVVGLARQVVERVAQEVHVAALPGRRGQDLADRPLQPLVVVRDHELHPVEPALLQPDQEVLPARAALAVGQLHRRARCAGPPSRCRSRSAPPGFGSRPPRAPSRNARRGSGRGRPSFSSPPDEGRELGVHRLVDLADRRGREGVPAQLLGDRLHLPRRHPLHVHLRQRRHQAPSPSAGSARTAASRTARPGPAAPAAPASPPA